MEEGQAAGFSPNSKGLLRCYQNTVIEARREHLSNLIESNCQCVLFKTIESVPDPPQTTCTEESPEMYNIFLHFVIDKVATAKTLIATPASDPFDPVPYSVVFDLFELVSVMALKIWLARLSH